MSVLVPHHSSILFQFLSCLTSLGLGVGLTRLWMASLKVGTTEESGHFVEKPGDLIFCTLDMHQRNFLWQPWPALALPFLLTVSIHLSCTAQQPSMWSHGFSSLHPVCSTPQNFPYLIVNGLLQFSSKHSFTQLGSSTSTSLACTRGELRNNRKDRRMSVRFIVVGPRRCSIASVYQHSCHQNTEPSLPTSYTHNQGSIACYSVLGG
jgi:hypothetical protein